MQGASKLSPKLCIIIIDLNEGPLNDKADALSTNQAWKLCFRYVKIAMWTLQMFDAIVPSDAFTKPNEEKAFCLLCGDTVEIDRKLPR